MSATPSTAYTHRSHFHEDGDDDDDDGDDGDDYDQHGQHFFFIGHGEHDVDDDDDDDTRVYIQHNNKYHRMSSQRKRIFTVRSHKLRNFGRASQGGQGRCKKWDENAPKKTFP